MKVISYGMRDVALSEITFEIIIKSDTVGRKYIVAPALEKSSRVKCFQLVV